MQPHSSSPKSRAGRFVSNDIFSLLDIHRQYNLGESTSRDLTFGELMEIIGFDTVRDLRLGYASASGNQSLRSRVAELTGVRADQVIITQGVAFGILLLGLELCGPGDEAVVVLPCFPPTVGSLQGMGGTVHTIRLSFDHGYKLDIPSLEQRLTNATRLICLASPQNPTGVPIEPSELHQLLAIMAKRAPNAYLFVDEIYREASYGDEPVAGSFAAIDPRVISAGSISKAYGAPGLRTGWLTVQDSDLRQRLLVAKMNCVISGSTLDEALAERVLAAREQILAPRREALARGLAIVKRWVNQERRRLDWVAPSAGALCCLRLRADAFDDAMIERFWCVLSEHELQLGCGNWFGETRQVFRLGFGYLPLDTFTQSLHVLSQALTRAQS